MSNKVESFELDHTKVKAPFVRKCCVEQGPMGDKVAKFDIRFMQPNKEEMESDGIHTLEHLLATCLREELPDIIDLSPMGCRTGFYMTMWGEPDTAVVADKLIICLEKTLSMSTIPADNEIQCGNYRLHSLDRAKEYAKKIISGKEKILEIFE